MTISRSLSALCSIIGAAVLAACGGGGGNDGPTSTSGTIAGSATKGIIAGATVTLAERRGGEDVVIGTGETTATGGYSFSYTDYQGGLVLACVEADADTTVICDASDSSNGNDCGPTGKNDGSAPGDTNNNDIYNFGEAIPVTDFRMCTCLTEPPANGVRAPITPFTELVVARADARAADASLSEDLTTALLNAASEVNQLVGGLDVLRLEPVNLADPTALAGASADALVYSALVAAVAGNDADDNAGGLDVQRAVNSLVNSARDGAISVANLRKLVGKAQEQLLDRGRSDDTGVLAVLESNADDAETSGNGTFDPEPSNSADQSRVRRARNLTANVRNTFSSLNEYSDPADAFGVDADEIATMVDDNTGLFTQLGILIGATQDFFNTDAACDNETCSTTIDGVSVDFASDGTTTTLTIDGTDSESVDYDIVGTFPSGAGDGQSNLTIAFSRGVAEDSEARLTVNTGSIAVVLNEAFNLAAADDDDETNDQSESIVDSVTFDIDGTIEALDAGATIASATGTFGIRGVQATDCALEPTDSQDADLTPFNVESFGVSGRVATTDQSAELDLSLTMANARSFCSLTDISPDNAPVATLTISTDAILNEVDPIELIITLGFDGLFARPNDVGDGPIADASFVLSQDGAQIFRLSANTSEPSDTADDSILLTVQMTDADNASLAFTANLDGTDDGSGDSGSRETIGIVTVDGIKTGEVQQLSTGVVIISYEDGTFETLG